MDGFVVYQASNGRWCISDRSVHKYLPVTMGEWDTRIRWDFRQDKIFYNEKTIIRFLLGRVVFQ